MPVFLKNSRLLDGQDAPAIITPEKIWRKPPEPAALPNGLQARVALSRWASSEMKFPVEVASDAVDDCHLMTMALRPTKGQFLIANRAVIDRCVNPGELFLTGPKTQMFRAILLEEYDFLRLYIPQSVMTECYMNSYGRPPSSEVCLFEVSDGKDRALQGMAQALTSFEAYDQIAGPSFLDWLGLAIASRLIGLYHGGPKAHAGRTPGQLQSWRLARVLEYIDAHLARPIYLRELSEVAGLSRMHFAAQFRAATGFAPHAYIIRQRVFRAQQLLRNPRESIVNVALSVGFSSQAHFTETFRSVIGDPPARWRRSNF